eukprot:gene342-434_t
MAQLTKKQQVVTKQYDCNKSYKLDEAIEIVKKITYTKFDASVDIAVHLGVDPRKADQLVRGTVVLPNGTGKSKKILVLCTPDKEKEAREAGADYVGLDDYIKKIEDGWVDMDVIITMPEIMAKVGRLGKILGPRGLMPNPKAGTVTSEIAKAVQDIKSGKIEYKVDKYGIVHASIGRVSFLNEALQGNIKELLGTLLKAKPASAKDATSLSVQKIDKFRRDCAQANIIYQVAKNTLIVQALNQASHLASGVYDPLRDEVLRGFSGILFFKESANVPAKLVKSFRSQQNSEKPTLKGAYVEGELFVGDQNLEALTQLKSKQVLIGELIALLQSPMANVLSALQSGKDKLSGILTTLGDKKE